MKFLKNLSSRSGLKVENQWSVTYKLCLCSCIEEELKKNYTFVLKIIKFLNTIFEINKNFLKTQI